jgi:hypothetical protein
LRPDHPFPRLRWLAVAWLALYLPSYAHAYGLTNFLFLCNLGVLLTAVGLWRGSALLLSAQAVAAMAVCLVWWIDAGARLLVGAHVLGVTAYMWNPQYPLATRLLSLYHVAWPILLLFCLRRLGYDRRGYPLQAAFASLVLLVSRLTDPAQNVNYAFADPIFHRSFGPAPVHLAVMLLGLVGVVYGATHLALLSLLPAAPARAEARPLGLAHSR